MNTNESNRPAIPTLCDREWVSAWVDGPEHAAPCADVDRALRAYADDAEAREAWATYHWVGDVLREGAVAPGRGDPGFAAAVMSRLGEEGAFASVVAPGVVQLADVQQPAANEAWFRWRWVAGVVGLGAVVTVAWHLNASPTAGVGPQWALFQGPTVEADPGAVVLRDPQLEAFLAAHRGQGGLNALQKPAGFMRNATYEVSQR